LRVPQNCWFTLYFKWFCFDKNWYFKLFKQHLFDTLLQITILVGLILIIEYCFIDWYSWCSFSCWPWNCYAWGTCSCVLDLGAAGSCILDRATESTFWVAAQEYSVKYSGGGWLIIKGYFGNRTVCVNVFIICGLFGIYGLFCSSVLCLYLLCVVFKSLLVFLLIELFCELFSWCDQLLLCINFHR